MCLGCPPPPDPAELVIKLEVHIRFRREISDKELAESYFARWAEWSSAKRLCYLQMIRAARQAAEIAEMEAEFWG